MKNSEFQNYILALLLFLFSACVPAEYKGSYRDGRTGATLELKGTSATFTSADGKSRKASKSPLKFKELLKAEEGIFMRESPVNKELLEIFWVRPDSRTLKEQESLVWFNAEVIHLRLRKDLRDKAQELTLLHSMSGQVTLDRTTELVQIGWAPSPSLYTMRRVQD